MISLNIDKNEVLRYLGYKSQTTDDNIKILIDQCIDEIRNIAQERYVYKIYDILRENGKASLKNTVLSLQGNDIQNQLSESERCVLLAVTLGSAVDMRIRYYEKINMTKALILNSCANTAVEEVCDNVCSYISEPLKNQSKMLTSRFSPGYGDLPVEMQKIFLAALEADKAIGLTVSSSNILIPLKSVTAIAGIINNKVRVQEDSCLKCSKYEECSFRRERKSCGF